MKKYAVIDIGTNSVKMAIALKRAPGQFDILEDHIEITRLGENISTSGRLSETAILRTIQSLKRLQQRIHESGVSETAVIATKVLRQASNRKQFIERVKRDCKLNVETISGDKEAMLSFLTVKFRQKMPQKNFLVFDTGGGSTEFFYPEKGNKMSLDIGAVVLTEQYLPSDPVENSEIERAIHHIRRILSPLESAPEISALLGIGGTVTTLGAMHKKVDNFSDTRIDGTIITQQDLAKIITDLSAKTIGQRKEIVGLHPKRADIILAGALIVSEILTKFRLSQFTISTYGIRHGLLLDRFN